MKAPRIALALALLFTSGAAAAQTASDAQCLLLSNVFAKNTKDANAQKAAEAALYFYLGRISDRASAAQLKTLLEAQAKTITDATAGNLMNACLKNLQSKVELVQSASPQQPAQKTPQGR
jgi:hypothetical protein